MRAAALRAACLALVAAAPFAASAPAAAATPALTVRTAIAPQPPRFGEHVTARIEVIADASRVAPGSIVVVPGLAPLVVLDSTRDEQSAGGVARVLVTVEATCDADACLPPAAGRRAVQPAAVLVRARGRDGNALSAHATWPVLRVASRLTRAALGPAEPPFEVPSQSLPATYRVAPHRLELILWLGAALLAVAALVLVGSVLRHRRRVEKAAAPLTLAEAISRVRRAKTADAKGRREALERLARMLEPVDGDGPADSARALAWGRAEPSPDAMESIAAQAERVGSTS